MKKASLLLPVIVLLFFTGLVQAQTVEKVAPGIWKVTYGTPEKYLPTAFKEEPVMDALKKLPDNDTPAIAVNAIRFSHLPSGVLAEMTVDSTERFYGFGLQINSFEQRGMRREIRTNSWPAGNIGFSHAPMPFYISSKGYGVLVNTSRYTTFYMASKGKLEENIRHIDSSGQGQKVVLNTVELYGKKVAPSNDVSILVKGTEGMELYVFNGPQMLQVMERYNLFSGGGALPPLWGLGFKYRAKATFTNQQVLKTAQYFRDNHIPCDVIGLEPGWQTAAYSCSFKWNPKNFPDPDRFVQQINSKGFKLNLWEHAYTNSTSPIFTDIVPYSGNYTVWAGAVPDFILPKARQIFGGYHEAQFVKKGIAAFKLDECDAANYELAQREWSFPDIAQFPSGVDGIQMRQIFGFLYQQTMLDLYRKNNIRTMFDVRASYLFAAPFCASLYSDMYSHADFVRMVANSGFAGLNWSPEVRETANDADLIRRMQTIAMSAQMVVNGWYLDLPPWLQYNIEKNAQHQLLPNYKQLEGAAKKLIDLRMSLLPYLYAAFARYHFEGIPPFRALVMDYPKDKNVWRIDDEYMMGESILCAPFIDSASTREVYFPEGIWYDFNNNKKYEGGKAYTITMPLNEIPMFIKDNTILPLAEPVEYVTPSTTFKITAKVYGTPKEGINLFEDNSTDYNYEKGAYNWVKLYWNGKKGTVTHIGNYKGKLYEVTRWEKVAP